MFSSAAAYGGTVTLVLLDDAPGGGITERREPMWPELRFDPSALLIDSYAYALTPADPARPRRLHSVVIDPVFDWGDDRPLRRPWSDTVVYEMHVKGVTIRHSDVPHKQRGSYAGLAHPAVLSHLTGLGVTSAHGACPDRPSTADTSAECYREV
jgi:glycogen operon protein